jgi:hypothetical protein
MKKASFIIIFLPLVLYNTFPETLVTLDDGRMVILFDDFTWKYFEQERPAENYTDIKDNEAPPYLRQGIKAAQEEIITAIEMYNQGWRYTMPRPRSAQAAWGNRDGRTTWWYGWWHNEKTNLYSQTTPKKSANGIYLGDNQNNAGSWRNGGSREWPDVYMFLLSTSGGPAQR